MKKFIFVVILSVVGFVAQAQKLEFFLSANIVSYFPEKTLIRSFLDENGESRIFAKTPTKQITFGGVNVGYLYKFRNDMAAGLAASYLHTKHIGTGYFGRPDDYKYDINMHYIAIMPIFKKQWWHNDKLSIYSQAGIGVMFRIKQELWNKDLKCDVKQYHRIDETGSTKLAYHVSALGVAHKISQEFSIFGEAGFGCMGLVNVGFRVDI